MHNLRGAYLFIDTFWHKKGDPIPQINFDYVKNYFKIDEDHILLHPEKQIENAVENEATHIKVFYLRLKFPGEE